MRKIIFYIFMKHENSNNSTPKQWCKKAARMILSATMARPTSPSNAVRCHCWASFAASLQTTSPRACRTSLHISHCQFPSSQKVKAVATTRQPKRRLGHSLLPAVIPGGTAPKTAGGGGEGGGGEGGLLRCWETCWEFSVQQPKMGTAEGSSCCVNARLAQAMYRHVFR